MGYVLKSCKNYSHLLFCHSHHVSTERGCWFVSNTDYYRINLWSSVLWRYLPIFSQSHWSRIWATQSLLLLDSALSQASTLYKYLLTCPRGICLRLWLGTNLWQNPRRYKRCAWADFQICCVPWMYLSLATPLLIHSCSDHMCN